MRDTNTKDHPLKHLRLDLQLGLRLQLLIVIASVLGAALIVWDRADALNAVRVSIREQNRVSMTATADRVQDYFSDVLASLLMVSRNSQVQAMSEDAAKRVQDLYDFEHERWRLTELYIAKATFDGTQRPFMTFESGEGTLTEAEVHTPERESDEYAILIEVIQYFKESPGAALHLNPEIDLCLPDARGDQQRGLVLSVPVHVDNELTGIVAAMIPVATISDLLERGSYQTMDLLVGTCDTVIGCPDLPADVRTQLSDRFGQRTPGPDDGTPGMIDGWSVLATTREVLPGHEWWLFTLYQEEAALSKLTVPWLAPLAASGIFFAGIALAFLVRLTQRRMEERLAALHHQQQSEQILRSIVEGTSGTIGDEFLRTLVKHISTSFGVNFVFVGELIEPHLNEVQTLAVWTNGEIVENVVYGLAGTPCANVIDQQACLYPADIQAMFPDDHMLVDIGAESYLGTPLLGADGRPVGVLALLDTKEMAETGQDLLSMLSIFASRAAAEIERRRADASRRRTEMLYTSIVESINEGIVVLDPNLRYQYWNRAMESLMGVDRGDIRAARKHPWDLFPHISTEGIDQLMQRALSGVADGKTNIAFTAANGAQRLTSEVYLPLKSVTGETTGVVGVIRDVAREVELEERLHQAQKLNAIGTLAGGIAHDFNNILQVVLGFSEIALDDLDEESAVRSTIDEIVVAGKRGAKLASQILTFSRKAEQKRVMVPLVPLIKETLVMLRSTLPSTIEIRHRLDQDCGSVFADPAQIQQVMINLVTNAYQAMRERGGILEVRLLEEEVGKNDPATAAEIEPGRYAHLSVRDTGPGMDEFTAERVFEPYFTTRKGGEGTGLGLASVHGIVSAGGGEVWVETAVGKGAAFHIRLPVAGEDQKGRDEEQVSSSPTRGLDGLTVLFVDDEEQLVRFGVEMLKKLGAEVAGYSCADEALGVFKRSPDAFDLLFTDLIMPGLTGLDLAREVWKIRPDLPVIVCTGVGESLDLEQAREEGVSEIIFKPVSITAITQAIGRVLGQRLEPDD